MSVFASHAQAESQERREWHAMSPSKRLQAVETLRQLNHSDYDPSTARVARVYTIDQRVEHSLA